MGLRTLHRGAEGGGQEEAFSSDLHHRLDLVFCHFYGGCSALPPQRAVPLATYMAIVARLAREVPGDCWLRYDRTFRQAAAVNPALPWDRREPDVWLAASLATVPASPTLRPQGVLAIPVGACHGTCKFLHVCSRCMAPTMWSGTAPSGPPPSWEAETTSKPELTESS